MHRYKAFGEKKMILKLKRILFVVFILVTTSSCYYSAQKPHFQTQRMSPIKLIDIDRVMNTTPDWAYDFEQGWNSEYGKGGLRNKTLKVQRWRYAQMQSDDAGVTILDPKNKHNHVMKFLWLKNGGKEFDVNTQKKAHLYGNFGKDNKQEEVWSFNVYFPTTGMEADNKSEIVIQWHAQPDQYEVTRNPPLALDNRNDQLTLTWLYDQRGITPPGFDRWYSQTAELGETTKDKWINLVFHIKWDPYGSGVLRVWRDGQLKVQQQNIAIGFNDKIGAYLGFGIYKFENDSQHKQRTILFDEVKQWLVK